MGKWSEGKVSYCYCVNMPLLLKIESGAEVSLGKVVGLVGDSKNKRFLWEQGSTLKMPSGFHSSLILLK